MKFQITFAFFLASGFFLTALLSLDHTLFHAGLENNFLNGTGGMLLFTVIFGLGWWAENFIESLVTSRGWNIVTLSTLGSLLTMVSVVFGVLIFPSSDFLQSAMRTSGYIFVSGYNFRFSALRPETISKLQMHN